MPKSFDPLEKVTLNLVKGDKDTLAAFYSTLGWSVAAREIIKEHCVQLRKLEKRTNGAETSGYKKSHR